MHVDVVEVALGSEAVSLLVEQSRGPMVYRADGRMGFWSKPVPASMRRTKAHGGYPEGVAIFDRRGEGYNGGPGGSANTRRWLGYSSTEREVGLLMAAKQNVRFRDFKGEGACQLQELEVLLAAWTPPEETVEADAPLATGDTAEMEIADGEFAGQRLLCRLLGRGAEPGTFNVRIPPQPPILNQQFDAPDVAEGSLHKLTVSVWRCVSRVGMDLSDEPRSDGPLRNKVARALHSLENNDVFRVAQRMEGDDGVIYLRLEDGRGWAYDSRTDQKGKVCIPDEASRFRATGIELPAISQKPMDEASAKGLEKGGKLAFTAVELEDVALMAKRLREATLDDRSKLLKQLPMDKVVSVRDLLWAEQPKASLRDILTGH